jgi:predicted nuclease with TOPRIM domain
MLKDLKVEKQKFENTSKEFQVFNAKANKKQEILGKIEDLDYKLDKFLAEKEKIWNDLSHINMKQNKNNIEIQKLSDKLTHYKSNPTKSYDDINSIKEIWIRLTNENAQIEKSKFDIAQKAIKNHMDSKKLMDSKS